MISIARKARLLAFAALAMPLSPAAARPQQTPAQRVLQVSADATSGTKGVVEEVSFFGHDATIRVRVSDDVRVTARVPGTGIPDIGDEWPRFVCVEAANALADVVTVGHGETHTLTYRLSVEDL